jgi:tRNA/rRNA methyltransferase
LEKVKLQNCRVVLVRPRIAANLGAVARVMRNMGLDDFVLVQPEADPADPEARKLSTHGEEILRQARVASSLSDAVRDCTLIAATSARTGGLFRRQSMGPPDEIIPLLAEQLDHTPVALVFGPEATGLTNAEIASCHYLIHIPTDPGYPALNLAQAAAICLYELRRGWLKRCSQSRETSELKFHDFSYSTFEAQERMFAELKAALEQIHFLYGPKADALMHALRHLIGRAKPSEMEIDVLLGLARQIRWYVEHHR